MKDGLFRFYPYTDEKLFTSVIGSLLPRPVDDSLHAPPHVNRVSNLKGAIGGVGISGPGAEVTAGFHNVFNLVIPVVVCVLVSFKGYVFIAIIFTNSLRFG